MPRETQRSKTTRVDAPLRTSSDNVRIQEQRRFFSARGNDQNVREARAIASAFSVGQNFISEGIDRANVEGQERAIEQAGAGGSRDVDDKVGGYQRAWDLLDDERTLHIAKRELPELLREMDAENLPEKEVQDAISAYMKAQVDGVDIENEDHTFLAAGLLQLEAELIGQHRDGVFAITSEAQRSDIFANSSDRYEASFERDANGNKVVGTGAIDYEYIGEQTNIFFDGAEKRTMYWEMIYELAINAGDPDAIRNVPERFAGSGEPTGINDPHLLAMHRTAIRAATVKQASMALARQTARELYNDDLRFGIQLEVFKTRQAGGDVSTLLDQLAAVPGTVLGDITSAKNFGDAQLEEGDSRSANLGFGVALWRDIYSGQFKPSDLVARIMDGGGEGFFGSGPQAADEMEKMLSAIDSVRKAGSSNMSKEITEWRTELNRRYNPKLDGLFEAINPVLNRIAVDANAMYLELTQSGTSGDAAYAKVIEKFDTLVNSLPDIDEKELTGRRGQDTFTGETSVSLDIIKGVLRGNATVFEAFVGVPDFVVIDRLMQEVDAKSITEEEAVSIFQQL